MDQIQLNASALLQTVFLSMLFLVLRYVVCKFIDIFFEEFKNIGVKTLHNNGFALQNRIPITRINTLKSLLKNIAALGLFGSICITILSSWGVSIIPLITGAGIAGIAFAFGAQSLVKDVVTGFFILLENQYNVGDKIEIHGNNIKGRVLAINMRLTILSDDDGNIYYIPNSSINIISRIKEKDEQKKSL